MSDNHELLQDVEQRLSLLADAQKKNSCVDVDTVLILLAVISSQQQSIAAIQAELVLIREQLRHLGIR